MKRLPSIHQISHEPVDANAGRVIRKATGLSIFQDISNPGKEQDQFKQRISEVLARKNLKQKPSHAKDWVGKQFGDIRVVAYSHSRTKGDGRGALHYWVVRCCCGEHEMRKHESLNRNEKNDAKDKCAQCKRSEYLRNKVQQ